MKTISCVLFAATLAVLCGCSTVKSRIQEKQHVFNNLDPQTQSKIQQGIIDIGYSTDMVYMAMGKPDQVRESTTAQGQETRWIYNTYWQQYEGSRMVGYRRHVYFDPVARAYRVYFEPVRQEIYSEHQEERTRVIFQNGRVTAIEQYKD
jgi:hypothetical protein